MPPKRQAPSSDSSSSSIPKKAKVDTDNNDDEEEEEVQTSKKVWLKKGAAAVDTECDIGHSTHVVDQNGDVYDAMMNQVWQLFPFFGEWLVCGKMLTLCFR